MLSRLRSSRGKRDERFRLDRRYPLIVEEARRLTGSAQSGIILGISVIRAATLLVTFIAIDILMCACILIETFGRVFKLGSLQTL